MKIVKFKDGTFGVRRWLPFGYEFLDLRMSLIKRYWWSTGDKSFVNCRGTEQEARKHYDLLTDKGTQVRRSASEDKTT